MFGLRRLLKWLLGAHRVLERDTPAIADAPPRQRISPKRLFLRDAPCRGALFRDKPLPEPTLRRVKGRNDVYAIVRDFRPSLPDALSGELDLVISPDRDPFFNGASVPWFFAWLMQPMEPSVVAAAAPHDLLYQSGGVIVQKGLSLRFTRDFADLWFAYLLTNHEAGRKRSLVAYVTVATFGGLFFERDNGMKKWPDAQQADPHHTELLRQAVVQTMGFGTATTLKTLAICCALWVGGLTATGFALVFHQWVATALLATGVLTVATLTGAIVYWTIRLGRPRVATTHKPQQSQG